MRRGNAERADHHGGEGVGEFALEHGAFAGDDAVILADDSMQERREHIRQMNLLRVAEISPGEIEILRHDAEREIFVTEDAADLADHFFDADVGAGVARAVVSGEEELQLCAGLPGVTGA